mgnify:CR=1 FL=1|jgi:FkbM family methyltransferase
MIIKKILRLLFRSKVSHNYSYASLANVGDVKTVIDIGVAYGTPELYEQFSGCNLVLIDPLLSYNKNHLKKVTSKYKSVYFVSKGVSDKHEMSTINMNEDSMGRSTFNIRTDLTHKVKESVIDVEVESDTLDNILDALALPGPYGIKIDTEGYEIKVLNGSKQTLKQTVFVSTEVSVAKRFHDGYSFSDLIKTMDSYKFRLFDILDMSRSNRIGTKYVDLAFIKKETK